MEVHGRVGLNILFLVSVSTVTEFATIKYSALY